MGKCLQHKETLEGEKIFGIDLTFSKSLENRKSCHEVSTGKAKPKQRSPHNKLSIHYECCFPEKTLTHNINFSAL